MVVVPAPAVTLFMVQAAPMKSAMVMIAPPCMVLPVVQRSSVTMSSARSLSFVTSSKFRPSTLGNMALATWLRALESYMRPILQNEARRGRSFSSARPGRYV